MGYWECLSMPAPKSLRDAHELDKMRPNVNTFYDVFPSYTEEELMEYRLAVGEPIFNEEEIENIKKTLTEELKKE